MRLDKCGQLMCRDIWRLRRNSRRTEPSSAENASEFQLNSVTWCVRRYRPNVRLMQTDNYESNAQWAQSEDNRLVSVCSYGELENYESVILVLIHIWTKFIFYLFTYWFSAGVICGLFPPAFAPVPSLRGLILCVALFVNGLLRRWGISEAVPLCVVILPNEHRYFALAASVV